MRKLGTQNKLYTEYGGYLPTSNYVNHYVAPNGLIMYELPENTKFMEIFALDETAWFNVGDMSRTTIVPTATIEDGTSPRVLAPNSSIMLVLLSDDKYFSIYSEGQVNVSFWSE